MNTGQIRENISLFLLNVIINAIMYSKTKVLNYHQLKTLLISFILNMIFIKKQKIFKYYFTDF